MLTYSVIGYLLNGEHMVGYQTPGADVPTVACVCKTEDQALREVERLNEAQVLREKELRWDRELRGLDGVYPELVVRGI